MAVNFLIALATAFVSATVILLVLIAALKVFKPESFAEAIPQPQPHDHLRASHITPVSGQAAPLHVVDSTTLAALSGEEIALLLSDPRQVLLRLNIAEAYYSKGRNKETLLAVVESLRGKQYAQRASSSRQMLDEVPSALAG